MSIPLDDKVILKFCTGNSGRFGMIESKDNSLKVNGITVAKIIEGNLVINGRVAKRNMRVRSVLNKLPGVTLTEHNSKLYLNGEEWDGRPKRVIKLDKSSIIESIFKIHIDKSIKKVMKG